MQEDDTVLKNSDKIKQADSLAEQSAVPELNDLNIPTNAQGGIDGCLIATTGIGCIIGAVVVGVIALSMKAGWLGILAIVLALVGLWFLIYPLIRLLFFGRDSLAPAILTTITEAVILTKVAKSSKKRNNRP